MRTPLYDILRKDPHGAAVWIEAATDVEAAKARILHLAERFPAEYLIFHQATARIVANFHFKPGEFGSASPKSNSLETTSLAEKTLSST